MSLVVRQRTGRGAAARWAAVALGLSGWLPGCDIKPPDGAYDAANYDMLTMAPPARSDGGAVEVEASIPVLFGGGAGGSTPGAAGMAGGSSGGAQVGGTASGTAGGQAGGISGMEGGAGGTAGGTPGGTDSPELARLKKLAGYYYMRMDMRSRASVRVGLLTTITTRNRLSHLLVTQLGVNPETGQLVGVEQLCHQTFRIECENSSCQNPSTELVPEVRNELLLVQPTRGYQITQSGSALHVAGASQTMYLGYDGSSNMNLPTSTSDSRVWQNGTGNATREGMWHQLRMTAAGQTISCNVFSVQRFVSSFQGMLAGSLDAPSLAGMKFTLTTTGSDGATLDADNPNCEEDPNRPPMTTTLEESVRFAPASVADGQEAAFWGCPDVAAWDGPMPPPAP